MIAWAIGWQELAVIFLGLILLPSIAGLVMFIIGQSIKKRGLWIAGLALLLIPFLLGLLAVAMVTLYMA